MNKKKKLILKTISSIIVIIIALLAFLLVGIKIFGFQIYTVLSGSMEPNYHVGSLVYTKKVEQKELKKDDVITFYLSGNTIATHRIEEIVKEDGEIYYRTKGDANETSDAKLTSFDKVIGKVVFTVPLLGYLSVFVQQPVGRVVSIGLGIVLIVVVFAIDSLTSDKKKTEVKNEKKDCNNK